MAANVGILPWSAGSGTTAPRLFTASELTLAQRVDAVSMMRFNTPGGTLAPYYARHGDGGLLAATDLIPAAGSWMPYLYSTNPHPDVVAGQDGNFKLVADNASKGGLLSAAAVTFNNADFTLYGLFDSATGDYNALIGGNDGTAAWSIGNSGADNKLYLQLNGVNQTGASAATQSGQVHCYVWQYTAATKRHQVWVNGTLLINYTAAAAPAQTDGRIRLCGQTTSTSGNSISNMMNGATYAAGLFGSANAAIPPLIYQMAKELMPLRAFP